MQYRNLKNNIRVMIIATLTKEEEEEEEVKDKDSFVAPPRHLLGKKKDHRILKTGMPSITTY